MDRVLFGVSVCCGGAVRRHVELSFLVSENVALSFSVFGKMDFNTRTAVFNAFFSLSFMPLILKKLL